MHSIPAYTVTIFGDLRDVETEHEFEEWLNKVAENFESIMIRSLVFRVDIEYRHSLIYTWNGEQIIKEEINEDYE